MPTPEKKWGGGFYWKGASIGGNTVFLWMCLFLELIRLIYLLWEDTVLALEKLMAIHEPLHTKTGLCHT